MNYESFFKQHKIYIHHTLENPDNVIKFLAYQQLSSLVEVIESISDSFSIISIDTVIQEADKKILSRNLIRQVCLDTFLMDKNVAVGRGDSASYSCRSVFTVRRLKGQLVEQTLHETANAIRSEICKGILRHIESNIQESLNQNFLDLKFKISTNLFENISSVVVFAIYFAYFYPLLGIIVAVGYVVVTFIWSVDVNSKAWRREIADEIYQTIAENKTNILREIKGHVQNMCRDAQKKLYEVSDRVNGFKRSLGQIDQQIGKK